MFILSHIPLRTLGHSVTVVTISWPNYAKNLYYVQLTGALGKEIINERINTRQTLPLQ
jgi:hypothetical protein